MIDNVHFSRLLAKEGITVVLKDTPTAYFDLKQRELCLPVWHDKSIEVTFMLIGHEVAHAVWTPFSMWEHATKKLKIPQNLLNVMEDIRIERILMVKYPGFVKDFKTAMRMLHQDGKFKLKKPYKDQTFLDRLNFDAKMWGMVEVPFSEEEKEIVARAHETVTFQDVINLCIDIMKRIEEEEERKKSAKPSESEGGNAEGLFEWGNFTEAKTTQDFKTIGTQECTFSGQEQHILKPPKFRFDMSNSIEVRYPKFNPGYLRAARPSVNHLVREFTMRRKANEFTRQQIHKTGVIDPARLASYRFEEDIFKSSTITPTGQSHSIVMLIDFSASMTDVMADVLRETLKLMKFCDNVRIPYVVWGFTSGGQGDLRAYSPTHIDESDGTLCYSRTHAFIITSSQEKVTERNRKICIMIEAFERDWAKIHGINMSQTPLLHSLILMYEFGKEFRRTTKAQKQHLVVLTDGKENDTLSFKNGRARAVKYNEKFTVLQLEGRGIIKAASPELVCDEVVQASLDSGTYDTATHYFLSSQTKVSNRIAKKTKGQIGYDMTVTVGKQNLSKREELLFAKNFAELIS